MPKVYLILGILICSTVAFANYRGWVVLDLLNPNKWEHHAPGQSHFYHK